MKFDVSEWELKELNQPNGYRWVVQAERSSEFKIYTEFHQNRMWNKQVLWGFDQAAIMFASDPRYPPILVFYVVDPYRGRVTSVAMHKGPAWVLI